MCANSIQPVTGEHSSEVSYNKNNRLSVVVVVVVVVVVLVVIIILTNGKKNSRQMWDYHLLMKGSFRWSW